MNMKDKLFLFFKGREKKLLFSFLLPMNLIRSDNVAVADNNYITAMQQATGLMHNNK